MKAGMLPINQSIIPYLFLSFFLQEARSLCLLAKLDESAVQILNPTDSSSDSFNLPPEDACVKLVVNEHTQVLLPLSELMDVDKERKRIAKQMAKVEKEREQLNKQLSSPKVRGGDRHNLDPNCVCMNVQALAIGFKATGEI